MNTKDHRGFHPMWKLQQDFPDLFRLMEDKEVTIAHTIKYDGAFLQRPFDPSTHLPLVNILKHAGIPIWCDFDDDLFTVQKDNSAYRVYGRQDVKEAVAKIASQADIITVATEELAKVYGRYCKNIKIIPNAVNLDVEPERKEQKPNKIVMWRGSDTHFLDLMSVSDQIKALATKNKDWVFVWWGYNPTWLTEYFPNCVFEGGMDIIGFYRKYQQIAPAITMVPLVNNVFNHSKSMAAWQQAVFANGVCVAPKGSQWKEWDRPGCLGYESPEHFQSLIQECMDGKHNITQLSNDGWKYITGEGKLTLDHTNLLRKQVLEELFALKEKKK